MSTKYWHGNIPIKKIETVITRTLQISFFYLFIWLYISRHYAKQDLVIWNYVYNFYKHQTINGLQACLVSSLTQGVHSRQQCCCHSCPRPCWCAQWKRWCESREVATGLRQLQGREKRSGYLTNSVFITRITTKFSSTKIRLYLDNAFLVTSSNGPHTVHKTLKELSGTIHLAFQLPCSLSTYTGPFAQTTFTAKQNKSPASMEKLNRCALWACKPASAVQMNMMREMTHD